MKQRRNGIIILIAVLAVLLFVFFLFYDEEKRYQWFENYRANSDQPYGTMFVFKLLESYREDGEVTFNKKSLRETLREVDHPQETDYILIGERIYLDGQSKHALVDFMEQGGDVFIATVSPPEELLPPAHYQECGVPFEVSYNHIDSVTLNFFHDALRIPGGIEYRFRVMDKDYPYHWNYFQESLFCDSTKAVVPLGFQQGGKVNFLRIAVGEGNLYLHSNPLVFTNYFLTRKAKVDYAAKVFSHLDGRHIIWDEYSKIPSLAGYNGYNSPLYFIMQQPALKYAWWLLLIAAGLYVIFMGKRKQRAVPVLEQKTNSSLEFVSLISTLHYKNGNHLSMARKKMKFFLYFVRNKYGIGAERLNEDQVRRLSEKSNVPHGEVASIFRQYELIEERFRDYIEPGRLVNLYNAIDHFYKNCK